MRKVRIIEMRNEPFVERPTAATLCGIGCLLFSHRGGRKGDESKTMKDKFCVLRRKGFGKNGA